MSSSQHAAEPITVHLRGEHSDAQLAVVEMVIAAGNGGPPLHVHPTHAEGFYILDGELVVQVRDETVRAQAGSFFFARSGTPHTFANFSGRDARLLVLSMQISCVSDRSGSYSIKSNTSPAAGRVR